MDNISKGRVKRGVPMIPASDKDTQGPHNFRKNLVKIKKNYTDGGFSSDEEAKSEKLEPWDDAPQYINQMKPRQPPNDREPGKVEEKEEVKVAGVVIKDQPITPKIKRKAVGHRNKDENNNDDQNVPEGPTIILKSEVEKEAVPLKTMPIQERRHTPMSLDEFKAAHNAQVQKNLQVLKQGSICSRMAIDGEDDIVKKQKIMRSEMKLREAQVECMAMFKTECHKLAEENNHRKQIHVDDGNARDKLVSSLLIQSGKLIDLWMEANDLMKFVDVKNEEILQTKERLFEKTEEREGLEKDNEGLRREIQILEEKLASVQSNNQKKDLLLSTVNQNIQDKKAWFNNLQATIRKVQASQQVLQSTMGKATGALSAAFENMDNVMEAV